MTVYVLEVDTTFVKQQQKKKLGTEDVAFFACCVHGNVLIGEAAFS